MTGWSQAIAVVVTDKTDLKNPQYMTGRISNTHCHNWCRWKHVQWKGKENTEHY